MQLHHLPLLIPLFFAFIWLERRLTRQRPVYSFDNTLLNLCCGIMERTVDLFFYAVMLVFFSWLHRHFALFEISKTAWWNWALAAVLLDFMYYWYHRASHTINVFWAAHVTHHQSEEFNLTVSFRNSHVPMIYKTLFWMPVPLLGFPVEMVVAGITVSGIWQFFLHTTLIGRLGFLEKILVTPSAHRVHHGSNEQYLDKNYGAIFIVWDRLFGTYAAENEPVRFGLTKPFTARQPLDAWFHYWADLARQSRRTSGFLPKMKLWLGKPGSFETSTRNEQPPASPSNIRLEKSWLVYLAVQILLLCAALTSLLVGHEFLPLPVRLAIAVWLFVSACCLCRLPDGTERVVHFEIFRQACAICLVCCLPVLTAPLLLAPVISLAWLLGNLRRKTAPAKVGDV